MLIVLSSIVALVVWVLLFGLGIKGFDGFMLSLLIVLTAGVIHLMLPFLPGRRRGEERPDPAPYL
jgi:hypothetical protein